MDDCRPKRETPERLLVESEGFKNSDYAMTGLGVFEALALNEQYTPFGYGTIPPQVTVVSPENIKYNSSSVPLTFTVNKPAAWIGYSLDGQDNITATGNTTLSGLPNGSHTITVYARDEFGNTATSETINFTTEETFPATILLIAATATAVSAGITIVYFKKRKHKTVICRFHCPNAQVIYFNSYSADIGKQKTSLG